MKRVFQGQTIKTEDLEYDFIEIRSSQRYFLFKTPFFVVPSEGAHYKFMTVSYYKAIDPERTGLLEYDELQTLSGKEIVCVKSDVFEVERPVEFQEFYKNRTRYLVLKVKIDQDFDISIENGSMVKDGCFYKVFGSGKYIFESENILYSFESPTQSVDIG